MKLSSSPHRNIPILWLVNIGLLAVAILTTAVAVLSVRGLSGVARPPEVSSAEEETLVADASAGISATPTPFSNNAIFLPSVMNNAKPPSSDINTYSDEDVGLHFSFPLDWTVELSPHDDDKRAPVCVYPVANAQEFRGPAFCINFDPIVPTSADENSISSADLFSSESAFMDRLSNSNHGDFWVFRAAEYRVIRDLRVSGLRASEVLVQSAADAAVGRFYNHVVYVQHPLQGLTTIVLGGGGSEDSYLEAEPTLRGILDSVRFDY